MRIYKLFGAVLAVLAFSAIASTVTASAAETLWPWLPGTPGETFKGKSEGKFTLQIKGSGSITCSGGSILLTLEKEGKKFSSELVEEGSVEKKHATLALAYHHFTGCKALGLPINSLADEKEVILIHVEIHDCVINKANKEFGLLILPLEVHAEIPSTGLLFTILTKGLYIAKIESEGGSKANYKLIAMQKEGAQSIEKCEGGEKESLLVKVDAEEARAAGLAATFLTEWDKTIDKEGESIE